MKIPTKSYVVTLHENSRSNTYLSTVFNDQYNGFVKNKLNNLDSISVKRAPISDKELANKKLYYDSTGEGNVRRFNPTLENHLKVSVGNDTYNHTKHDKIQIADTTTINPGNAFYLLPQWKAICNDKINDC